VKQLLGHSVEARAGAVSPRVSWYRAFRAVSLALLAFCVVCGLIGLLLPDRMALYAARRSEKLQLAEHWASLATVAVFGSSHMDNGFDPRAFDAVLAKSNWHARTINLAVSGGGAIEQAAMAGEFAKLATRTRRDGPVLMLLELNLGPNFAPKYLAHPRAINLYDRSSLALATSFADPSLGMARAVGRMAFAAAAASMHYMNIGMLSAAILKPPLDAAMIEIQTGQDRRGHTPLLSSGGLEEWADLAQQKREAHAEPGEITRGQCETWRRLASAPYGRDLEFAYVVTPTLPDLIAYKDFPRTIRCDGVEIPIINVAVPALHPELYDPAIWNELAHLSESGASVFTQLVAAEVVQKFGARLADSSLDRSHAVH
jgi:hypothetical protein